MALAEELFIIFLCLKLEAMTRYVIGGDFRSCLIESALTFFMEHSLTPLYKGLIAVWK